MDLVMFNEQSQHTTSFENIFQHTFSRLQLYNLYNNMNFLTLIYNDLMNLYTKNLTLLNTVNMVPIETIQMLKSTSLIYKHIHLQVTALFSKRISLF